jgi:hypothetical protein
MWRSEGIQSSVREYALMGVAQLSTPIHWNYFLALEDDLYQLARYVEFNEANYGTYSIEIARLLLSASAEVDSVLKQLARRIEGTDTPDNIGDYFKPVTGFAPRFVNFEVTIPRHGLTLHPWEGWSKKAPPLWWTAHNKVKHQRHEKFDMATLKNCINAMAALLISVLHLYDDEAKKGMLVGLPKLFTVPPKMGGAQQWTELGHSQMFYLDDADNPFFNRNIQPQYLVS